MTASRLAARATRRLATPVLQVLPLALLPGALAAQQPAAPQVLAQADLDPVIVTATRGAQPLSDVVADVSLIDRETLDRSGLATLADVLSRVPGIEFVRNGGPGGSTSLFLRGGENRFGALYIDGVRVDSQATGGVSWAAIPLSQIDRIEVLRGPAAAVYGSDAITGVVQIFTRKGEGPFTPRLSFGAGSHHGGRVEAGFIGSTGAVDYALDIARETSRGFDAQPGIGHPDRDGHRQTSASGRLGWQIDTRHRLEATGMWNDVKAQYDGFMSSANDRNLLGLRTLGVNWTARWSEAWEMKLSANEGRDEYESRPDPYQTDTRVRSWLWQNEFRLGAHRFTAALERREDRLRNDGPPPIAASRSQDALALGWGWTDKVHTVQLNLRHDDDSEFGGKDTGSLAYAYAFNPRWRVTASTGTAFRAPTLYQRFSQYGTGSLRPESARNLELGVRYAHRAARFDAIVYRSRIKDLISFGAAGPCASAFGCYENTGWAELEGLTLSGAHRIGGVNLWGSADFQRPRDLDTGKLLARRARRHATLGAEATIAGWTVGGELKLSGQRHDDAANTTTLGGYGLVNLHASRALGQGWTLQARIDNLADKDYQLARSFATTGRTVYVGLKWSPR